MSSNAASTSLPSTDPPPPNTLRPHDPALDGLTDRFRRRQLPLALLTGLIITVAPPVLYHLGAQTRLHDQARLYAEHTARTLAPVAAQQPYLWRYNVPKVIAATSGHQALSDLGTMRITDCAGDTIISAETLGIGSRYADGPDAWSPIRTQQRVVAWVHVSTDARREASIGLRVALGAAVLGLLLGTLLLALPMRIVRRQAAALNLTFRRLTHAEDQLTRANRTLQDRVLAARAELRHASARVVSVQEEERRRIGRDLHDSVGQILTGLRLELERTAPPDSPNLDLCDSVIAEIRHIVRDLKPVELANADLPVALRAYTERFEERTRLPASFRLQGTPRPLPEAHATALFRVLQEALNNVSRHAEASEVGVVLALTPDAVVLTITDDGQGFDPDTVTRGVGLDGMRERVALLSGEFALDTHPEGGTRVRVTVPIDPATPARDDAT